MPKAVPRREQMMEAEEEEEDAGDFDFTEGVEGIE